MSNPRNPQRRGHARAPSNGGRGKVVPLTAGSVVPGIHFPKLRIAGGPVGHSLKVTLDGRTIERLHHLDLTLDVNDVNRATYYQFVEVDVDAEIQTEDGGIRLAVFDMDVVPVGEMTMRQKVQLVVATGATIPEALRAAAAALEAKETAPAEASDEPDGPVQ